MGRLAVAFIVAVVSERQPSGAPSYDFKQASRGLMKRLREKGGREDAYYPWDYCPLRALYAKQESTNSSLTAVQSDLAHIHSTPCLTWLLFRVSFPTPMCM